MTRADIQTADITSMDAMYKLKAHTLALHDELRVMKIENLQLANRALALHYVIDKIRASGGVTHSYIDRLLVEAQEEVIDG